MVERSEPVDGAGQPLDLFPAAAEAEEVESTDD
jgi:hypothetical protein